jgi:hypothetical protein
MNAHGIDHFDLHRFLHVLLRADNIRSTKAPVGVHESVCYGRENEGNLLVKKIIFVCVENSNRSQMAEAFARIYGGGKVEAYSAGSRPSGRVIIEDFFQSEFVYVRCFNRFY